MLSKINAPETKITASPAKGQVQRPEYTKSYAKGCIVWYRAVNLQSDVQKIFRNAKKMNEKMPIFYKVRITFFCLRFFFLFLRS